jgi:D-glycero-alpha-D-manno-heptose-7-phosphate kinase
MGALNMIIVRTPFRVSFLGGGTDYPGWYRKHGGSVLSTTIDKYCYITCRYLPPFHEHRILLVYSQMERCNSVDEIKHPAARAVLHFLNLDRGVEIHTDQDLPGRSGMGSSSAFTVGLLHAVHALQGRMVGKRQLAEESMHLEQNVLKEAVGSQDQVNAAYGGLNHVQFHPNGEISVRPVTISQQRMAEFNGHLMMFYTGIKRTAADIAGTFVRNIDDSHRQLRIMRDLVDEGLRILSAGQDIAEFGGLLNEAWMAKRSLSSAVSNPEVDGLYERARRAGALGGKLTGAGGGGFLLLFVKPEHQDAVRAELCDLIHVPFEFDTTGSQVIHYEPGADYSSLERARTAQSVAAFRELELTQATTVAAEKKARRRKKS